MAFSSEKRSMTAAKLENKPWCTSSGASSEVCGMTDRSDGGGLGEKEEEDSGVVAASL